MAAGFEPRLDGGGPYHRNLRRQVLREPEHPAARGDLDAGVERDQLTPRVNTAVGSAGSSEGRGPGIERPHGAEQLARDRARVRLKRIASERSAVVGDR